MGYLPYIGFNIFVSVMSIFTLNIGTIHRNSYSRCKTHAKQLCRRVYFLVESFKFVNVQLWFINGLMKIQKKEKTKLLQMTLKNQIATKVRLIILIARVQVEIKTLS